MLHVPVQGTAKTRQLSKATGYHRKSTTFPKGEKDVDFEAAVLMNVLCKPWELGGHPHDFLVAHRSARITDATQFYERDTTLIRRHERMVAEKVVWNRQRAIREEMLQLLTRLHSIEKQRRHFNVVKKQNQETLDSPTARSIELAGHGHVHEHDANANTQILSSTFVNNRVSQYPEYFAPTRSCSRPGSHNQSFKRGTLMAVDQDEDVPNQAIVSPMTVAEKKAVQDLDAFEVQLEASKRKEDAPPGSAASFRRIKRK